MEDLFNVVLTFLHQHFLALISVCVVVNFLFLVWFIDLINR